MRKTEKWNRLDIVGFRPEIIKIRLMEIIGLYQPLFLFLVIPVLAYIPVPILPSI